jgi:FkbH-like protein
MEEMMEGALREDLVKRLKNVAGFSQAYADLKEYLSKHRTIRDFHFGFRMLAAFRGDPERRPFRRTIKIALLASYTIDFLVPLLETDLMLEDLECEIYRPRYNQFRQEIFDSRSALYTFRPDITIVAFDLADIFENRIAGFHTLAPAERRDLGRQAVDLYESLARHFHENMPPSGPYWLLLQNQGYPFQAFDPLGRSEEDLRSFLHTIDQEIGRICRKFPNAYLLDYAKLIGQYGSRRWTDPRLYYTARIPVARDNWLHLSDFYVRHIKAALNLDIKCVVLDLDNTLWGGILGEDGIDNIQLGCTYPGVVFRHFQQYLLALHAAGYILAVASKNNWEDVCEVFERHASMVLRQEHFAGMKVNWRKKAENIRDLSSEIHISPDHMLLVDDNPVEILEVQSALPAVRCLQLESPPLNFLAQFSRLRCFGKLAVTDEDRRRGEWYLRDRQRRDLKETARSLDDFYRSLRQRLVVYTNARKHLSRIVQLSQRTNQFNMTTIRLDQRCVEELLGRPDSLLITAELYDRFGDNGVIAYVQVRKSDHIWHIDNFLMSCRALGRNVEESLLRYLVQRARDEGVDTVEADFVPSGKNQAFADFYARNGFRPAARQARDEPGPLLYTLDARACLRQDIVLEVVRGEGSGPAG